MMRSRLFAEASCSSTGRSMTSLIRSSFGSGSCGQLKPRKSLQRIVGAHAGDQTGRKMRRDRVVAIELPVRVIGREQEHDGRAETSLGSSRPNLRWVGS